MVPGRCLLLHNILTQLVLAVLAHLDYQNQFPPMSISSIDLGLVVVVLLTEHVSLMVVFQTRQTSVRQTKDVNPMGFLSDGGHGMG